MKATRFIAIGVIVASGFAIPGHAQLSQGNATPAEFPPSSYTADQYVDSRGCVFIRAGIDGNVTWVPRVNRQRRQICGQTPSLGGRVAQAPAPAPAAEAPERITVEAPAAAPAPAQAAPAPRTARAAPAPAPRPSPRQVQQRPAAAAPAPAQRRVVVRRPAPSPAPAAAPARPAPEVVAAAPAPAQATRPAAVRQRVQRTPACAGLSPVSRRYVNSGRTAPVRCGPQAASPTAGAEGVTARAGTVVRRGSAAGLAPGTRIVPRHVYTDRQNTGFQPVPEGYRRAWEDDRLNPRRAEGSVRGYQRMQLIWTDTVPRRLINQATGQDVTGRMPLVYPYTDIDVQRRELGNVTFVRRGGQLMKRVERTRAAPAPTLSTRSAPEAAPAPAPKPRVSASTLQGQGMVQAALYRDEASARNAARQATRLGVPVRLGQVRHRGEMLQAVMLGPFRSGDAQVGALRKAQAAGFRNARLR